jgi:hypothetical protein
MRRLRRWLVGGVIAPLVVCGGLALISAASNIGLPRKSRVVARLGEVEEARLEEALHLRQTLGDAAWPGWGSANIPAIVYNERYAFLVGLPDPAPGWVKVPQGSTRGGPWEVVPDDRFEGEPYFRQVLPSGTTPEAFTVQVGDHWVSSLSTKEWMRISLAEQIRGDLPAILRPIFPYRLATGLLISNSDFYISALLHEAFHAYQGIEAPEKLAAAENAVSRYEARYPWEDEAFRAAWQAELDLLAKALRADTPEATAALAREFLAHREQRREMLGPELIAYERHREWAEGLARYIELEIWRQAATTPGYEPVPAVENDPDFKGYRTFERRWSREVDQMRRMAGNRGDGRFYYSGMAQAVLLDRLAPGWKHQAFDDGVWLDDLLAEALGR